MFKALTTLDIVQVEAAPAEKFKAPTDVSAKVPEVVVEMDKFPDVFVQADVPPEANVAAPVEFPRVKVEPAVDAKFVMPVEPRAVNAPELAVVEPIAPGASQVPPSKLAALKA